MVVVVMVVAMVVMVNGDDHDGDGGRQTYPPCGLKVGFGSNRLVG